MKKSTYISDYIFYISTLTAFPEATVRLTLQSYNTWLHGNLITGSALLHWAVLTLVLYLCNGMDQFDLRVVDGGHVTGAAVHYGFHLLDCL